MNGFVPNKKNVPYYVSNSIYSGPGLFTSSSFGYAVAE
jgi:hypothetical protein